MSQTRSLLNRVFAILLIGLVAVSLNACSLTKEDSQTAFSKIYEQRSFPSPDGIGKMYLGREIAQVMGHQGAAWLERSSRMQEERPGLAVNGLGLQPTDMVADIGAGTGYFSFRLALLVPQGKVLAVDIQPEMLEILNDLKREKRIENVEPILGSNIDPHLPAESVDLALMVDAYHEFDYPYEMMTAIVRALKPGGRVALVEYRGENPFVAIKRLHKMTQKQVRKEMEAVGLTWQGTQDFLPQQHLMIFSKGRQELGVRSQESGVRIERQSS